MPESTLWDATTMEEKSLTGRTLGHFRILSEIGRGGMGVVYRARDTRLQRDVAIKVLPSELADAAQRFHRFKVEARSLARLNHRNIVTIYEVDEQDGIAFLVMELVEGKTLAHLIPWRGFELQRIFSLAIDLAEAVGAAHDQQVTHRDLKPGNVMVTPEGQLKVLDFGLAKLRGLEAETFQSEAPTEPITRAGRGPGTVPYMSPEQLRGDTVDHRSDIFSLGIILYQITTGHHPFPGKTGADSVSSILRDQPSDVTDLRVDLPRHLGRMIRQCLDKRPERRLQSAKDLANGLKDLRRELNSSTEETRAPTPSKKSLRRNLLIAGLALVLAVTALVVWIQTRTDIVSAPQHLSVTGFRSFSGDSREPEYFRAGIIDTLRRRLGALQGVFVLPDGDHPEADFRLETDVQRGADMISVSYRLVRPGKNGSSLGGDVLEARLEEVFPLLDRIVEDVGKRLRAGAALKTRFTPKEIPTDSPEAFDLYLKGSDLLEDPADLDRALELLSASIAEDPGFALAHAAGGETRRRIFVDTRAQEVLDAARDACADSAALDPALPEAQICLGDVFTTDGRSVQAASHFQKAIELDATAHRAYEALLGAHLALLGNPAVSERAWRQIIEIHPDYWAGYYYLGKYWSVQANYDSASELYRQALELAPENAKVYTSLGGVLVWKGDYENAIVALERAIAIRPGVGAYSNLGTVQFLVRRFDEAIEALEKAVQFPGAEHFFFGNLGRAYYWGGRQEDARATFERAIEMSLRRLESDPANVDARILLPWYQAMIGDRESALTHLEDLLDSNPEDPHVLFTVGQIQNQLGDTDRALEFLERAVAEGYSTAEIRQSIEFDNLRDEPRFDALLSHEDELGER